MKKRIVYFIVGIIVFLLIYNYIQISKVYINRVSIKSDKINSKVKILQISDFHSNKLVNMNKLMEKINNFNPDIIVLTGDIIDRHTEDMEYVFTFLENLLSIKKDIFFVLGNHEISNKKSDYFIDKIQNMGINILEDKVEDIIIDNNCISIVGFGFYSNENDYFNIIDNYNLDNYNLFLTHSPNRIIDYSLGFEDLILTGHTHGGQIRLPLIGAILAPGQDIFPKYDKGIFKLNKGYLYIDSGLGNSFLPIRILNRIQISNIIIEPK